MCACIKTGNNAACIDTSNMKSLEICNDNPCKVQDKNNDDFVLKVKQVE